MGKKKRVLRRAEQRIQDLIAPETREIRGQFNEALFTLDTKGNRSDKDVRPNVKEVRKSEALPESYYRIPALPKGTQKKDKRKLDHQQPDRSSLHVQFRSQLQASTFRKTVDPVEAFRKSKEPIVSLAVSHDIWAEPPHPNVTSGDSKSTSEGNDSNPGILLRDNSRRAPKHAPSSIVSFTPSGRPAVKIPHAGQSYRPDSKVHDKLLSHVARRELTAQKKKKRFEKQLKPTLEEEEVEENEENQEDQLIQFMLGDRRNDSEDESESERISNDWSSIAGRKNDLASKEVIGKSDKERRRLARKRLAEELQRETKKQRKHDAELQRAASKLKKMVPDIDAEIVEADENQKAYRDHQRKVAPLRIRRIGRQRYRAPMPAFSILNPEKATLRTIPGNATNLLQDRFSSLQERNMIIPRSYRRPSKKAKKRLIEKK